MDLGPWPQIPRAQADACAKRVAEIQSTFHDEVDMWDTTMVSEYADEILQYMGELEVQTMPNPDYLDTQAELTVNMRFKLVDWIAQVHMRYHLLPETLWIAVNIMDRFLSKRAVSLEKVQLVGMTALFIAAKYEEIIAPSVEEFVWISDKAFSREEILKGERIVLQTLDFRVSSYCSPYTWVRRISKADDYDLQTRTLSKFLIECTLLDHRFLRAKPSLIAALGMYSARKILGGDWDAPFIFYSGFTAEELDPGHIFLLEKLVDENFAQCSICLKYASKKFLKASLFAIDWAKNNYTTLTQPGVEQKMLMT
ncbi:hypothetical protein SISNIDRAFT_412759 [Sistotremastrum niveocremeum HHB9708]|uniref:Uncharacterized protein n=1 Tax=Sistotremastrum niveocremeum HHB9708 TaxID=1314777 RepID=A0A164TGL6_9AGAM|nr:hypothetical protein SISNIDRAFT_412759 [Sistotremastrum niveocremeum HHB9708]